MQRTIGTLNPASQLIPGRIQEATRTLKRNNKDHRMRAKREYYKKYVDGRTRIRRLIYLLILLVSFCIVMYDSFVNDLPFHYILFFFLGRFMSMILKTTHKVRQKETDGRFTVERNLTGFLIIIIVLLLRIFLFPRILTKLNVVFVSDAVFLIVSGWFLGRINMMSDKIEEKVFSIFMQGKRTKQ
jgi:hypothetical protein